VGARARVRRHRDIDPHGAGAARGDRERIRGPGRREVNGDQRVGDVAELPLVGRAGAGRPAERLGRGLLIA
jgi:hypothetical protein